MPDAEGRSRIRIAIDYEFSSRTWWDGGGRDLWESVTDAIDDSAVVLDESVARSWLAQAETLEGWDEGHEFAPHPVSASPMEDDDEDL